MQEHNKRAHLEAKPMDKGTALLLGCLKTEEREKKLALLRGCSSEDWEKTLAAAARQRILPNLYHACKPFLNDFKMPGFVSEELRSAYYNAAARNMRLYDRLMETTALFERHKIPVILLKGAHLAELVYGNLALRPMSDIDLLAREGDLDMIHKLLTENGFHFPGTKPQSNTKHLAPYCRDGGVFIEIHFHITDPPYTERFRIDDLWNRSRSADLHGQKVSILSPEDLLLHICQHTCIQHGFDNGLISVLDTAQIAGHYCSTMDWDLLRTRSRQWGIERAVHLMLMLAEKMFGMPMPASLKSQSEPDPEITASLHTAEELILTGSSSPVKTTRYLARLFEGSSWREKLNYLRQRTFPSGETVYAGQRKVGALKPAARILFYLRRVIVQFRRHGKTVWQGLRGDPQTLKAMQSENKKNRLRDWLGQA
jgi:hypothetical protein